MGRGVVQLCSGPSLGLPGWCSPAVLVPLLLRGGCPQVAGPDQDLRVLMEVRQRRMCEGAVHGGCGVPCFQTPHRQHSLGSPLPDV